MMMMMMMISQLSDWPGLDPQIHCTMRLTAEAQILLYNTVLQTMHFQMYSVLYFVFLSCVFSLSFSTHLTVIYAVY